MIRNLAEENARSPAAAGRKPHDVVLLSNTVNFGAEPVGREGKNERGIIAALTNGLSVLDLFRVERSAITVGEVADHLGLHKSSASRIVATLVQSGFLRPAFGGPGFQLGGKLSRLGSIASADNTLAEIAQPIMKALVEDVGETCHVGELQGREAVTIALVDGSFSVRMHSWVGKRSPAHWTAMGKVLLADLPESTIDMLYSAEKLSLATAHSIGRRADLKKQLELIREEGYALDNEELEIGLRCVSTPIFDGEGRATSSLTIAGAAARITMPDIDHYVAKAKQAAKKISEQIGGHSDRRLGEKT